MFALTLNSCATIVAGGNPKIILDSDVTEPVTIITTEQTYKNVTFPVQVKVSRHAIDGQRIMVKSENYEFKDVMLEKTINDWTFGNILFGGFVGWGIDLITNCVSKPSQKRYYVHERKKEEQTPTSFP